MNGIRATLLEMMENIISDTQRGNQNQPQMQKRIDQAHAAILAHFEEMVKGLEIKGVRYDKGSRSQIWAEGYRQALADIRAKIKEDRRGS